MKVLNLATVGLLSATILTGGITAFAEEAREVQTEGQVTFTPNTDEDTVVIPPETGPDAPDVEIDPEVPGTTGPLTIAKAATMNFGSQVISNQDQTYNMVAEMQNLADGSGQVPYVSFAQVQDTRGTNAGWDLKVSLDDFTAEETHNDVLTGAEVSLLDPRIQYEGSNVDNAPAAHTTGLKLIPGAGAVSVMTAEDKQGAGSSSVVWGDQADLNAQFANNEVDVVKNGAIQLFVPGSTAKDAATYTSTLSWELSDTPGENGEEV